jgi:hypothetical protein
MGTLPRGDGHRHRYADRVDGKCDGCGEPLVGGRADRRYCGAACRKAAFLRRRREREAPELAEPAAAQPLDRAAVLEEALSEERLLVYVAHQARTSFRAASWVLERRFPERWADPRDPRRDAWAEPSDKQRDDLAALRAVHRRAEIEAQR